MANLKTNHIVAALKLPSAVAMLIALAKAILTALTSNKATFPAPTPPLAQFSTDIDSLDTAEIATKTKGKGLVAVRDEKRKTVTADLHQLVAYVQQIANLHPDEAASIIESAGMSVRKTGSRSKPDLAVKAATTGAVHVVAKASAGARAHEWQYSTDGKNWTAAPTTTQAKATLGNLPVGVVVYFRHRPVTKAGPGDWSAIASMAVS
jgi:hypothetical protein